MTEENEKQGSSEKRGVFKLPKAGYPYFGQAIGILMFDTKTAVTNDLNVPAKLQESARMFTANRYFI